MRGYFSLTSSPSPAAVSFTPLWVLQLHHHAVLVLEGDHAHAAAHRRASLGRRVVAREVLDLREVIDLALRAHLSDTEIQYAQPLDAEGVRLPLEAKLAVAPGDPDAEGDGLALDRYRAVRLLVGRREAADTHERRHHGQDPRSPHRLSFRWKNGTFRCRWSVSRSAV